MEFELALDARAELGEGPVWDDRRKRLLFVDIMRGHVHAFDPETSGDSVLEVGQPVGAVTPTERGDYVIAAGDGFFRLDPDSGRVTPLAEVECDMPANRMNDGYCDPRGRFWAGTMAITPPRPPVGSLYRLDPDGTVSRVLSGVTISNGIDWSLDGTRMYYVDTRLASIDVFDYDAERGEVANRRSLVTIAKASGYPDGLVVDADGFLWLALWAGGAIHRYAPDGRLDRVLTTPVTHPTKCAFGGPELRDLYVTSAAIELTPEARAGQPHAGGLYRCRPGVRGHPARRFAG